MYKYDDKFIKQNLKTQVLKIEREILYNFAQATLVSTMWSREHPSTDNSLSYKTEKLVFVKLKQKVEFFIENWAHEAVSILVEMVSVG